MKPTIRSKLAEAVEGLEKRRLPDVPGWVQKALQGVTYWIGHRRCLYSEYPIGESALVAEVCNLIFAHLDKKSEKLRCEVSYRELVGDKKLPRDIFKGRERVDLAIFETDAESDIESVSFLIEVKRGSASARSIDADLQRLAKVRAILPKTRCFLFVISEAKRHKRFVGDNGFSVDGKHPIPDCDLHYRVRRTYKAMHALKTRETAQWSHLLEIV